MNLPHSAGLYCVVLCFTELYHIVLQCMVLHVFVLCFILQYHSKLYIIKQYYAVLKYIYLYL